MRIKLSVHGVIVLLLSVIWTPFTAIAAPHQQVNSAVRLESSFTMRGSFLSMRNIPPLFFDGKQLIVALNTGTAARLFEIKVPSAYTKTISKQLAKTSLRGASVFDLQDMSDVMSLNAKFVRIHEGRLYLSGTISYHVQQELFPAPL